MGMSPAAFLDRFTGGRGALALKFSMVSVVGVTLTQVQLVLYLGLLDWGAVSSNLIAVSVTALPVFLLNKHWVWSVDGKISFRREVLPFWLFTLAGLALSTGAVAVVDRVSDAKVLVLGASLAGFGVLWVAKFLFLDQVMFGHPERDEVLAQEVPVV